MLLAHGSLSRRQDWLFSLFSPTIHCILSSRVASVRLLPNTEKTTTTTKKQFLHTLLGLKESLIPLLPLALLAFHFLSVLLGSRRLWLPLCEAFEAPKKWRDRFLIANCCIHSNAGLRTRIRTWDPVASNCCSCLPWQISSPARMIWLLQDLDFHFNNPKTSLDSAKELNLNT